MKTIVIISDQEVYQKSLETGEYTQSTLDSTLQEVGFLHCSQPDQTIGILNRKFTDRENLMILLIDADKVLSPVKYEPAPSGTPGIYPHIYGPLNTDAIYAVAILQKDASGLYITPPALTEAKNQREQV